MKKIISILTILLLCFVMTSCSKELSAKKYCERCADIIKGERSGVIVDLRILEGEASYSEGHISGAKSYDLTKHNIEDIYDWLRLSTSLKTPVYLIDSGNGDVLKVKDYLKKYKKIYIYTDGYQALKETSYFSELIIEAKGTEGCDC